MDFLEEFDRRAKSDDARDNHSQDLSNEDRELLEFADLVRSRLPRQNGERNRVLKRLQNEQRPTAPLPLMTPPPKFSHIAWATALVAGVLVAFSIFLALSPLKPKPRTGDGPLEVSAAFPGAPRVDDHPAQLAAIAPAPRFDPKSIQDEFSEAAFPEPVMNEGQGAAAVEAAGDPIAAHVTRVFGLAMYQNKDEKRWHVCSRGQALAPGAIVRTSKRANSSVRVLGPDGSMVSVSPNASIMYQGERAWSLTEGGASFDVASRKDLPAFTVATPHGRPRALGTQFTLEVGANGTMCWVDQGKVALTADGAEVCEAGSAAILNKQGVHRAENTGSREWLSLLQRQMDDDHGIGQLVAKTEKANEHVPLEIKNHNVNVTVIDQVARTFVDMVFVNNSDRRLEGTFYYPLPADASISEFAMYVGDQRIVGEVLEQQKARQVFEYIVRQQRDPALLEYAGGNLFKMRVFPIEPRSEKRVQLGYTQILQRSGGKVTYTYPLFSEMLIKNPLQDLKITFNARSSSGLEALASSTHQCASAVSTDKRSGAMAFHARNYSPLRDFTVTYDVPNAPECSAFANQRPEDPQNYFMLQLCPAARSIQSDLGQRLLLIVDGSASSGAQDYAVATEFAASSADMSRNWQFGLIRGGQRPEVFSGGMVETDASTSDKVREFLQSRTPLGATDLLATFRAAANLAGNEPLRIVYIGDGIDTLSEASSAALLRDISALFAGKNVTISTVAVGSSYERPVLQGLASNLGGTFVRIEGADGIYDAVGRIFDGFYRSALRNVRVTFEGVEVCNVYPEIIGTLTAGDTAVVLGRVKSGTKGRAIVRADADGEAFERAFDIELSANETQNRFLPRLWAKAHMDALISGMGLGEARQDAEIRNAVIETSCTYQIMSPFTSFLVLESEEDYARYGIKRKLKQWDWKGDEAGVNQFAANAPAPVSDFGEFSTGDNVQTDSRRVFVTRQGMTLGYGLSAVPGAYDGTSRDQFAITSNGTIFQSGPPVDGTFGPDRQEFFDETAKDDYFAEGEKTEDFKLVDKIFAGAESAAGRAVPKAGYVFTFLDGKESLFGRYAQSQRQMAQQQPHYSSLVLGGGKLVDLEVDEPLRAPLYYQRILNAGKSTLSTQLNLSLALESEGRFADALKTLLPVLEKQPALADLHLQHASLAFRTGNDAEARAALATALDLAPGKDLGALKERIAALYASLGRHEDAAALYVERANATNDPDRAATFFQNAAQHLSYAAQKDKARVLWEEALKRWPDNTNLRAAAAQAFSNYLQDNQRALSVLREGKNHSNNLTQQLLSLLYQMEKRDELLAEARKIVAGADDASIVSTALSWIANVDRNLAVGEAIKLLAGGSTATQVSGSLSYLANYSIQIREKDVASVLAALARKDISNDPRISAVRVLCNAPEKARPRDGALLLALQPMLSNVTADNVKAAVSALDTVASHYRTEAVLKALESVSAHKDSLEDYQRASLAHTHGNVLEALGRKNEAAAVVRSAFEAGKNESAVNSLAWTVIQGRISENDFNGAIDFVGQYIKRFPESQYAPQFYSQVMQQARCTLKGKDLEALTDRLLTIYPNTSAYIRLRVSLLMQQGKVREAIEAVKGALKALDEAPMLPAPEREEAPPAAAPEDDGQNEEQRKAQQEALARERASQREFKRLALIDLLAQLSGQDAGARKTFLSEAEERAKTENPGAREWTEAILTCLSASGDTPSYIARLERLSVAEPKDPTWARRLGIALASNKQFDKARMVLTRVWEAERHDDGLALTIQRICVLMQDGKAADEWFNRAFDSIAKDPARLYQYAANWQSSREHYDWALRAWKRYAETGPEGQRAYAWYQAGYMAQQSQQNAEAIADYFNVLLLKDGGYSSGALSQLVTMAAHEEQLRDIESRLVKATETQRDPSRTALLHLLDYELKKLKGDRNPGATERLNAAVQCKDVNLQVATLICTALMQEGRSADAEKYALNGGGNLADDLRRTLIRHCASNIGNGAYTQVATRLQEARERLYRKLLEAPDSNADSDSAALIQCLAEQNRFDAAEQELRRLKITRDNWMVRSAWSDLVRRYQSAQRFHDAIRLAREHYDLESDDAYGYKHQAFDVYTYACVAAQRNGKLKDQGRADFQRTLLALSREYFETGEGTPPWYSMNNDDWKVLSVPSIDRAAEAAAHSDEARRLVTAGLYYAWLNQRRDAIIAYERALKFKGSDERSIWPALYSLYRQNPPDWPNSLEAVEKMFALKYYDETNYLCERGRCLYGLGRKEEARAAFRKLLESPLIYRSGYYAAQRAANQCEEAQDYEMAAEAWELSLRMYRQQYRDNNASNLASFYYSCAQAYVKAGDSTKAVDCYLRGMSIVPRNDSWYKQLSNAALETVLRGKTLEPVIAEYLKQIAGGASEKPHLRIAFAEAYQRAGDTKHMLEHLRVAANLLPHDAELRKQVIDGYRALKDNDAALAAYKDWARVDPQNIDVYRGMGDLFESLGKHDDSQMAWATMAEVRPREAEGYREYAQKLMEHGLKDRAAVAFRQAVKYRPTEYDIANELSIAYAALGQKEKIPALWTEGEAACRKAMDDVADDPAPWLNLGRFLSAQGKKDEAKQLYTKILNRTWPRFQNETRTEAQRRLNE